MLKKWSWKRKLRAAIFALFAFAAIGFAENKNYTKVCAGIIIDMEGQEDRYFLTKEDVEDVLTAQGRDQIVGGKLIHIDLKQLELRVKNNKFVEHAQVLEDLKGNLVVKVAHARPIARVIGSDSSYYISDKGKRLPLSNRHTARVVLISGEGVDQLFKSKTETSSIDPAMFDLLSYIEKDKFLSAQVAGITVDKRLELTLHPQITKQVILFGGCEQYVDKFKRLKLAYNDILPRKGWNTYESINLKFNDQIICK